MPQSWSTQSTKHKDELKTNVSHDVMTSKPATPIVSSNTNLQQSQAILSTNKEVANADLGRVIAAPTVQKQLLADQTFSNKDGSGGSRIFPRGGREPSRGGVNTPNFPENCMKSKEFGRPGGGVRPSRPPPRSANGRLQKNSGYSK